MLTAGVLCLAVMSTCIPQRKPSVDTSRAEPPELVDKAPDSNIRGDVIVFFTGNELGALKPCGCSGGQLGGLDRRPAVFASVPRQRRLIVDAGSLVESDSEQNLIKFNIIMQAFDSLGYDVVNLTEKDIEIGKGLGLLDDTGRKFNIISSHKQPDVNVPVKFTKPLRTQNGAVKVIIATFDMGASRAEQIGEFFSRQSNLRNVNIAILNRCDAAIISSIADKVPAVDCLVCPSESDDPMVIGDPNKKPLVISVGRFGRYVSALRIIDTGEKQLKIGFSAIAVNESLPQDNSLVELYKTYQQLVKDGKLLEKMGRFTLPDNLKYVGSDSCKFCHEYEYQMCSNQGHAHAYATLEKVGSQYDPECAICHTVGMKYESGFVSEEKTGYLKDVGCENCHGPGSEHIKTLGAAKSSDPKSRCIDCHTPEQSRDYAANQQLYFDKIVHWREPNTPGDVKK
jgi:nitrate/TMAO reductase-like tetraheme cytochrome c subunit